MPMASDITVVVADESRMAAIRSGLAISGRVVCFPTNKVAAAWESIQLNHPKLIAVEALFGETPQGRTFMERVEGLEIRGSAIQLIVRGNGNWATTPYIGQSPAVEATTRNAAGTDGAMPIIQTAIAVPKASANTRRAQRFQVLDPLTAIVEGADVAVVNLSVIGAQVVTQSILRPAQTVKIELPNSEEALQLIAAVAWSTLEQAKPSLEVYYRAGMEFTNAATRTLEEYCRQHCVGEPLGSP